MNEDMEQRKTLNACEQVEEGRLPFTWKDVLAGFEVGQSKRFLTNGGAMVSTIRSHIGSYQKATRTDFSTECEGPYIIIKREK